MAAHLADFDFAHAFEVFHVPDLKLEVRAPVWVVE